MVAEDLEVNAKTPEDGAATDGRNVGAWIFVHIADPHLIVVYVKSKSFCEWVCVGVHVLSLRFVFSLLQ